MAGHAQLKFVMTECSKTQIRLTGLNLYKVNGKCKYLGFKSDFSGAKKFNLTPFHNLFVEMKSLLNN